MRWQHFVISCWSCHLSWYITLIIDPNYFSFLKLTLLYYCSPFNIYDPEQQPTKHLSWQLSFKDWILSQNAPQPERWLVEGGDQCHAGSDRVLLDAGHHHLRPGQLHQAENAEWSCRSRDNSGSFCILQSQVETVYVGPGSLLHVYKIFFKAEFNQSNAKCRFDKIESAVALLPSEAVMSCFQEWHHHCL